MRYTEVEELLGRVKRLATRLRELAGDRFEWDYTFEDGETHRYVIKGVRPPELIADDLSSAFVWLWSLKDYLKEFDKVEGRRPVRIEEFIDSDPALPICGDIANSAKHGRLRRSRSGTFARLGAPHYSIPQEAMSSMTFKAFEVGLDVAHPELVEVSVPVENHKGGVLGDGVEYLMAGLASFEALLADGSLGDTRGLRDGRST